MSGIFINYRREDSAPYAGRLYDRLSNRFGADQVFMDVDDIPPGADFAAHIGAKVASCDAMLAVIGKNWLTTRDANGQLRLSDPHDFVGMEVALALQRSVLVIPVLVGGASMPTAEELRNDLRGLSGKNAVILNDNEFQRDIDLLIQALEKIPALRKSGTGITSHARDELRKKLLRRMVWKVPLIALLMSLAVWWQVRNENDAPPAARTEEGSSKAAAFTGAWQGEVHYPWGAKYSEHFFFQPEGDKLFVPVENLDRVQKYLGGEGAPALHRLGTSDWTRARGRARKVVQDVAEELLKIYSLREARPGIAFAPDTAWQQELESSFPYEETADQLAALAEIKADMESDRPMDRLLCGDVGFGKTELALRAAFKASMSGKQVALLAPTTVLAQQHFHVFTQRLEKFPVTVEMLSRFVDEETQARTLEGLKAGQVDIVVGTHRLLQRDVRFKRLGLLIVDEEHRFGVMQKERLKKLRTQLDVLSLSATPIPRTLHMAVGGIRDMSVIQTPPEERQPIKTYVTADDDQLVREAITRELQRGGQVYYVHNRVRTIEKAADRVRDLIPNARVIVGHGQMPEDQLAKVMVEFESGKHDVLVCSTIIESGLDIPNVNTIIVERADRFGLAQLYQLRGRVGRSAAKAYAYLLHEKQEQCVAAANLAANLSVVATVARPKGPEAEVPSEQDALTVISPGQTVPIIAKFHNGSKLFVEIQDAELKAPTGIAVKSYKSNARMLAPGEDFYANFQLTVENSAEYTRPHWHRENPETDSVNTIDNQKFQTLPFPPPALWVNMQYSAQSSGSKLSQLKPKHSDKVMEGRISVPVLAEVLAEHPEWHFVTFGKTNGLSLSNGHVVPWQSHSELSTILDGLDVGFMPYDCSDPKNLHCVPLKLFDYFARGIPVVSTPIVYLRQFEDLVYLGTTPRELGDKISEALAEPLQSPKRAKRQAIARKHSIDNLSRLLVTLLDL